jgi:multidrug resistance efflux pump
MDEEPVGERGGGLRTFAVAVTALAVGAGLGAAGVWQWQQAKTPTTPVRAAGEPASGPGELDVVSSGRVTASGPEVPVMPTVPGQVKAVRAVEGMRVQAGVTVLFELDDTMYKHKVAGAEQAVLAAKYAVREAEVEKGKVPLYRQMQQDAIDGAVLATDAARKALQTVREQQEKNPTLPLQSSIDEADAQVKRLAILEGVERKRLALLDATDVQGKVDQATAYLGTAQAELAAAKQAVLDCVVRAPADGMILRVLGGVGAQAAPGMPVPIAILVPAGPLVVRAELDQEHLGKVVAGQKVTVRDESRADSPTWDGQVLSVSRWVARPRGFILEPGEVNDVRTAEVVIEPKGTAGKGELWIGQRVRVRYQKVD